PLPYHPQLHAHLPERFEPGEGDRGDQEEIVRTTRVSFEPENNHVKLCDTIAAAISEHPDLPPTADIGPVDHQQDHGSDVEHLRCIAGGLADCSSSWTACLSSGSHLHSLVDRSNFTFGMHLSIFRASLWRASPSCLGRGVRFRAPPNLRLWLGNGDCQRGADCGCLDHCLHSCRVMPCETAVRVRRSAEPSGLALPKKV